MQSFFVGLLRLPLEILEGANNDPNEAATPRVGRCMETGYKADADVCDCLLREGTVDTRFDSRTM